MTTTKVAGSVVLTQSARERMAAFGLSESDVVRAHTARKPGNMIIASYDVDDYKELGRKTV